MKKKTGCAALLSVFMLAACEGFFQDDAQEAVACVDSNLAKYDSVYDDVADHLSDPRHIAMLRAQLMAQTLEIYNACGQGQKPRNIFPD